MNKWLITQAIIFQLVWLCCILGGNTWLPLSVGLMLCHFFLSPTRRKDALMLLVGGSCGFLIDFTLLQAGVYSFVHWPYWLIALWSGFVLNFGHSLHFLSRCQWWLQALIGSVAGPYAYWASMALDAVIFPHGVLFTLVMLAAIWSIWLPILIRIDRQLTRFLNE